jgi:phytoene dehydrogenase-like protein
LVVGGGLSGLTVAAYLGRAGLRVEVLERSETLGGRAATDRIDGFSFNRGAHALYRKGDAARIFKDLGVPVSGGVAPARGHVIRDGELFRLPSDPLALVATGLLSWGQKASAARWFGTIPKLDPEAYADDSVASWLDRTGVAPEVRALIEAFVRVSTFTNAPETFSARTAIVQLKKALGGVLYVDRGWQTLVDGVAERAKSHGAKIRTGVRVAAFEKDGDAFRVSLEDGTSVMASTVVVATAPRHAAELLGNVAPTTARSLWQAVPVRIATLDVALTKLPRAEPRFILGVDRPLYLSVHSGVAEFTPEGGALIHVGKYLPAGESDPNADRAELEALLEMSQPEWRRQLVHAQYLPSMRAAERLDLAGEHGADGRPSIDVPELDGVYLAGDWVKGGTWLTDAAMESARRVAEKVALRRGLARAVA